MTKLSNFTAVSNDLKPVLFANPAVGYAEIAVYLYLAMHVQVSEDAGKGTRFKMFRKGTVHIWFKDLETLNKINYVCGRSFN